MQQQLSPFGIMTVLLGMRIVNMFVIAALSV